MRLESGAVLSEKIIRLMIPSRTLSQEEVVSLVEGRGGILKLGFFKEVDDIEKFGLVIFVGAHFRLRELLLFVPRVFEGQEIRLE